MEEAVNGPADDGGFVKLMRSGSVSLFSSLWSVGSSVPTAKWPLGLARAAELSASGPRKTGSAGLSEQLGWEQQWELVGDD